MKRLLKILIYTFVILFAIIGFGLTVSYLAIKLHITDDPGAVDYNDRIYQELADKTFVKNSKDSLDYYNMTNNKRTEDYMKIMILGKFYPYNANLILNAVNLSSDPNLATQLLDAIDYKLANNKNYIDLIEKSKLITSAPIKHDTIESAFDWMNIEEWDALKIAIKKDKKLIDSAAFLAGVEPRLIVCCLIGEQIRLFNSKREIYKSYIGPLKVLSVESKFSLGVAGVKDFTAMAIERNLKDTSSVYYIGEKYKDLLNFSSQIPDSERYHRLTSYRNHFYQYLYPALYLKQIQTQWKKANFDISNRPEILVTLYNVGFISSTPKADPKVGGSRINIHDKLYTFGGIGFDFYYSGELAKEFPYMQNKFWD